MAADTQSSSPFSRLPRLGFNFGFKPGPSSPLRETYTSPQREKTQDKEEDWYIPYNGPIESPRPRAESNHDRESWGDLLNGWLTEDPRESPQNGRSSSRARALSTVTHLTSSSGNIDPSRKSIRMSSKPRVAVPSFINLDQAGGIGDVPMPAERSSKYESTIATSPQTARTSGTNANRSSLASIWSFGKKGLRHSASLDQLSRSRSNASTTRERANTSAQVVPAMPTTAPVPMSSQRGNDGTVTSRPAPIAEDNEYYYSSLLVHQSTPGQLSPRQEDLSSHPYAIAFPSASQTQSIPPTPYKGKAKVLNPGKLTITWLDPRQKSVPGYLKPSPRSSVLKASLSTPNLRDLPKGKQRWLSAETWCDALILPRPRFALRLAEGQSSGRIVSPPGSPVSSPEETPKDMRNRFAKDPASAPLLKQSASLSNLMSTPTVHAPPSQSPEGATPVTAVPVINEPAKTLRPHRPKSWALDDLALPSPVPSLAQCVLRSDLPIYNHINIDHMEQSPCGRRTTRQGTRNVEGESHSFFPEQTCSDIFSNPIKVYWGLAGEAERQGSRGFDQSSGVSNRTDVVRDTDRTTENSYSHPTAPEEPTYHICIADGDILRILIAFTKPFESHFANEVPWTFKFLGRIGFKITNRPFKQWSWAYPWPREKPITGQVGFQDGQEHSNQCCRPLWV